jgi:hypothetical protein
MGYERHNNSYYQIVINDMFVFVVKMQLLLKSNIKFIRGTSNGNGRSVL